MRRKSRPLFFFVLAAIFLALAMTVEQILVYSQFLSAEENLWLPDTPGVIPHLVYLMILLTALFAAALSVTLRNAYRQSGPSEGENNPSVPSSAPSSGASFAEERARQEGSDKPDEKTDTDGGEPSAARIAQIDRLSEKTPAVLFLRASAALAALSLTILPLLQIFLIDSGDHLDEILRSGSISYQPVVATLHIFSLILALPAAFFFLRSAQGKRRTAVEAIPLLLFLIAFVLRVYFDMSLMLNNPRRLFSVVTLLSLLLYVLCEVRLVMRPDRLIPYGFFTLLAMTLAAASGFSNLFLNLIGVLSDGAEVAYYLFEALFSLYLAARLVLLCRAAGTKDEAAAAGNAGRAEEKADAPLTQDLAASDGTDASDGHDEPPVTRDELNRFFNMVYAAVASRRDSDGPIGEEEEKEIRAEAMEVLTRLLTSEDRTEAIRTMRRFLAAASEEESGEGESMSAPQTPTAQTSSANTNSDGLPNGQAGPDRPDDSPVTAQADAQGATKEDAAGKNGRTENGGAEK